MKNAKICPKWDLNFSHLKLFYGQIMHFYEDRNLFFIVQAIENPKIQKKNFQIFFGFLADFLALKFSHFCPFGLAPGHLWGPKVYWAKPWLCPKPIRSHPMQVHWHSIAKNPTKVENTFFVFWGLKVATFGSIFHLDLGPQNTNLGALGVPESICAHSSIL